MDLAEFTGSRKGRRKTGNDQIGANPDLVGAAGINVAAPSASSVDVASAPPTGINLAASSASSINVASAPPVGINVAPPPTWRVRRTLHYT